MNHTKKLLWLLVVLVGWPMASFAQSGKITGKVLDAQTGQPLIGANVVIDGTTKGASTNADGEYVILNVAPGTIDLKASYIGYTPTLVTDVRVRTDLTTEQDFKLQPQSLEGEEIVVQAERKAILKDVTSSESRVSSEDIEKLPVQEVSDVIKLQSGVNVDDNGQIHIRGGRASEVSYVVDGIRVTDDYNRSQGVRIENQSIQELNVVSGTFNAEYGQAMSGIINIVTKTGGNQFKADVRGWSGGYLVGTNKSIYDGLATEPSKFNPDRQYNLNASVSGPIVREKLTFFASARTFHNDGWLTGRDAYSPHGPFSDTLAMSTNLDDYRTLYNEKVDLTKPWYSLDTLTIGGNQRKLLRDSGMRDSSLVHMNPFDAYSFQGNLEFKASNVLKFKLIGSYGHEEGRNYNHQKKLVPYATPTFYNENYQVNLKTTVTPASNTFLNFNAAYTKNSNENYLYKDPYDPRYFNYDNIGTYGGENTGQQYQFDQLGTINNRFFRSTESYIGKAEISSQVTERHFIKAGADFQGDVVNYENINLQPLSPDEGIVLPDDIPENLRDKIELGIPELETPNHSKYTRKPINVSAYVQDKIEYDDLIINAGLRFDFFDPNANIPADPKDPDITNPLDKIHRYKDLNGDGSISGDEAVESNLYTRAEREAFWWDDASPKYQVSPRIGVAYSISDQGVVHFSYGYFFQMPSYQYLYNNSQILLEQSSGVYGIYGNPNLKPERSIQYEIGYKQEIFSGTALKITGFYKDSRDYVSSGIIQETYVPSVRYATWINRDYANSRGFTLAIDQSVSRRFNFSLDYTYTVAEGSNSDPAAAFNQAIAQGNESGQTLTKYIQPLDWDRHHIVNGTFFYSGKNWGFNVLGQFQTGTPYTPSTPFKIRTGPTASVRDLTNTARLPSRFLLDLNAYKNIPVGKQDLKVFLNVYNIFDSEVITNVYSDSGEPNRPLIIPAGYDEGYLNNPGNYGEPRRIQIGVELSF